MRCSKCGVDNRETARFCDGCGAQLQPQCPSCGALIRVGARFCDACGAALSQSPSHSPSPPAASAVNVRVSPESAAPEAPEGERKTVTALFADIKGSTELMEDLDPEEARVIIDPALKIMVEAVRRYEGYVVQSTGDGIFALFGAPVAHEDHPQRALYAALQIQQELRATSSARRAGADQALEARIGVNTGEVVVRTVETGGKVEYTPIGHTANLASRLQTVAPAGSIAVSETHAQSGRRLLRAARAGADRSQRRQRTHQCLRGYWTGAAAEPFPAIGMARADEVRRAGARTCAR